MSSEWRLMTLKEAGVSLIDCDHRTPAALDEGYPYIAIPQLKNGHIALDGVRRISREDYIEWTKSSSPKLTMSLLYVAAILAKVPIFPQVWTAQ